MTEEENEPVVVRYPEDEYVLLLGRLTYSVSYFEWAVLGDLSHIGDLPPELAIEGSLV